MRGRCCKCYLNSFSFELNSFSFELNSFSFELNSFSFELKRLFEWVYSPFYPFSYLFSFLVCL
ncbi:hypothetical protein EXS92_06055 [Helicobacter pylori]|nr:hypothetical protein [Helicobacter pylori]